MKKKPAFQSWIHWRHDADKFMDTDLLSLMNPKYTVMYMCTDTKSFNSIMEKVFLTFVDLVKIIETREGRNLTAIMNGTTNEAGLSPMLLTNWISEYKKLQDRFSIL